MSFRLRQRPYPMAFEILHISQGYADGIGPRFRAGYLALSRCVLGVFHIAGESKSVFELAKRRKAAVQSGSRTSRPAVSPENISRGTTRRLRLKRAWEAADARRCAQEVPT